MKKLVIAITAFVIGWYICGYFALQSLDSSFSSNDSIVQLIWPDYFAYDLVDIAFLGVCLCGVGLVLSCSFLFTKGTVPTHHRNRYHRSYRKTELDTGFFKRFTRLVIILMISTFVASLVVNALFWEVGTAITLICLSFAFLGMFYGVAIIQKIYGKAY